MPPRSPLLFLAVTALLLLAACASAPAATSRDGRPLPTLFPVTFPHATVQLYDVHGSTESEIRTQLSALGPGGYDAYTKWYVRWNWPGQGTANCRLPEAEVSYDITVTFPRWTPTEQATPELVAKWNGYLYALALHENGHVSNVVEHYPAVVAAIKGSTCLAAEGAAQAVLQEMRQFDTQYDHDTDHGRTQGARFP
jgi:predicted secreted Zn-dependent protease